MKLDLVMGQKMVAELLLLPLIHVSIAKSPPRTAVSFFGELSQAHKRSAGFGSFPVFEQQLELIRGGSLLLCSNSSLCILNTEVS